jgi:hypothetical protein
MPKEIPLTKGYVAIVDDEDYERLISYSWQAKPNKDGFKAYAVRKRNKKLEFMHRVIMCVNDSDIHIDHINGDTMDNRKSNLRICSRSQNGGNRVRNRSMSSSKYKGVNFHKRDKLWTARINKNGKSMWLGYFNNEIDAAKAYNKAAEEVFKEFAKLNIIEEPYAQKET